MKFENKIIINKKFKEQKLCESARPVNIVNLAITSCIINEKLIRNERDEITEKATKLKFNSSVMNE